MPGVGSRSTRSSSGWSRSRAPRRPRVEVDHAEVDRPHEVRLVVGHELLGGAPGRERDRRRLQPVRHLLRHALLPDRLLHDPVDEALHHRRALAHVDEHRVGDRHVVLGEVELRPAGLGEVDLRRVGEPDLAARPARASCTRSSPPPSDPDRRGASAASRNDDDPLLVLGPVRADRMRVDGVGQVPVLDRPPCRLVVEHVELALDVGAGRDQQRRRVDLAHLVLERRVGRIARQHADRREHHPAGRGADLGAAQALPVLERAGGGAVGDEGRDVGALRRDLDQRRRRRSRARRRRSGPGRRRRARLQEVERAGDVLGPVPAVVVLAALALAAPAGVVDAARRSRGARASTRG